MILRPVAASRASSLPKPDGQGSGSVLGSIVTEYTDTPLEAATGLKAYLWAVTGNQKLLSSKKAIPSVLGAGARPITAGWCAF